MDLDKISIDPFTGPLTADSISEWLSRCEEAFERYNDSISEKQLSNKQKIQKAATTISTAHTASKSISTWYTQNRRNLETKDWDTFRDMVKDHALGKGWRIKVLRDFYTYNQGLATVDDYLQKFEDLRFTISRSSKLSEIEDTVYKCHILFGARPDLLAKFMRAHKNDQQFIDYEIEDIRTVLKDFDSDESVPAPVSSTTTQAPNSLQAFAAAGSYITSGLFGATVSTSGTDSIFSCLNDLPTSSTAVGHIASLACWWNNDPTRPQIQLLSTVINGVTKYYPHPWNHNNILQNNPSFGVGEYLVSVTMTRDSTTFAITSIAFVTSRSQAFSAGIGVGERTTFTAPEKWRIVGFHGTAGSYTTDSSVSGGKRYPITKLGVVYAPIL
ncbi:hypothetical protein HD806DRAFT_509821 [Xylariaceae sp. AK1471]|nr:hypothetical protein HD806DRAFT_509821 [Xylariaceae sp. AK1471]